MPYHVLNQSQLTKSSIYSIPPHILLHTIRTKLSKSITCNHNQNKQTAILDFDFDSTTLHTELQWNTRTEKAYNKTNKNYDYYL